MFNSLIGNKTLLNSASLKCFFTSVNSSILFLLNLNRGYKHIYIYISLFNKNLENNNVNYMGKVNININYFIHKFEIYVYL